MPLREKGAAPLKIAWKAHKKNAKQLDDGMMGEKQEKNPEKNGRKKADEDETFLRYFCQR
jgi:hypothetical protein